MSLYSFDQIILATIDKKLLKNYLVFSKEETIKTYFLLALCVLFWSGNFVVGRYIKGDIEPVELAFFRWLFVLIIVLPYFIIRREKILKIIKNNFLILTILSLFSVTLFNTILYVGLIYTEVTNALLINLNVPIIILILSYFILKQQISLRQLFGVGISTIGVVFLVLHGEFQNLFLLEFQIGDLWILLAAFTWSLYSVLIRFRPKELNDYEFFTTIVIVGFILLLPLYFIQGYEVQREIEIVSEYFWIMVYISLFSSILSYYFWHYGIEKIGANKTSQFTYLMPLFGSLLAYIFLGEVLEFYHLIGAVFILLGIYLSLFYKKRNIS